MFFYYQVKVLFFLYFYEGVCFSLTVLSDLGTVALWLLPSHLSWCFFITQVWDLLLLYFYQVVCLGASLLLSDLRPFKLVLLQNHLSWCFFVTKKSESCCSCTFTKSCVLMFLYRQESILGICCLPSPKIKLCSANLSVICEICTSAPDQPDDPSGVLRWLSVSILNDWC